MGSRATLYQTADAEIRHCIDAYVELGAASKGFAEVLPHHLQTERARTIVMAGFGLEPRQVSPHDICQELRRRQAVSFDVEAGVSAGAYAVLRPAGNEFFEDLSDATEGFREFDPDTLIQNPHFLPIVQHLCRVFSKAKLREHVGSVSDVRISRPAANRLADLLRERVRPEVIVKGEILQRLESTYEGIVRDLVGRVLLESVVAAALRRRNLTFQRERDYASLPGVVYDFRADFVLPDAAAPRVVIEVRKSSSRHASLYAKDKMFSAINWKGRTRDLMAVLIVDGTWTKDTLRVMANVFDFVVPISRVDELAQSIGAYLEGDGSQLKWLIDFRISPSR